MINGNALIDISGSADTVASAHFIDKEKESSAFKLDKLNDKNAVFSPMKDF